MNTILRSVIIKKYLEGKGAKIGNNFIVGKNCLFRIQEGSSITIGDNVIIGDFVMLNVRNEASLIIGECSHINFGSRISCFRCINIGKNCLIASYNNILDHDHVFDLINPPSTSKYEMEKIILGNGVWLGTKVHIGKGVTIGDFSVIGANAVVTKNVPASSVYGGVPAKRIR